MRTTVPLLVMLFAATTVWAVDYIDAYGGPQSVNATVLTGSEGYLGSDGTPTWYVVSNDISYTHSISCYGNVNIILTDGKTMSVSNNGVAIRGEHNNILTIYGQHNGTGTLTATSTSAYGYGIFSDSVIVINGGTVTATGQYGIHCDSILINGGTVTADGKVVGIYASHRITHNITINGGKVTATGAWAIHANGGIITLGWRNNSDFIKVSEYNGTVNIKDGQALINGTNIYRGNNVNIPDNVTLTPANFTDDGDDTYTIWSAVGWGMFCDALQDNTTYNRFSGKTVKLNNDIGTLEDPITRMAGSSNHDFCGTFDGQGHTVTVNLHSDERDYAGLFCYVSETTPTGSSQVSHPFIMNLEVAGSLTTTKDCTGGLVGSFWGNLTVWRCIGNVDIRTSNKHAGGLIGAAKGSAEINNCSCIGAIISSVEGDGTHGGFIGKVNNGVTVEITGCLFGGSLIGSSTTHCSGFVGYNSGTLIINGSLLYPGQMSVSGTGSATFARGNSPTINQSYYTQLLGEAQGTAAREITAGDNVTIGSKALSGETVVYNVSGITAYRKGGLKCSSESTSELFFGEGDTIELELSYAEVPGYVFDHYTVTGGGTILAQTDTTVSLTMSDADQTIGVHYAAIPTHSVTFAYGNDNTDWTIDGQVDGATPYEGKTVTVAYSGPHKVKRFTMKRHYNTLAELKAAICEADEATLAELRTDYAGKVICSDGHLHNRKTAVPVGCTAVAVLGYINGGHIYAIALQDAGNGATWTWNTITNNGTNKDTNCAVPGTWNVVAPDGASWVVTTEAIYKGIFQGLGGNNSETGYTYNSTSNAFITEGVGGKGLSGYYWSTSCEPKSSYIYGRRFTGSGWGYEYTSEDFKVRPVLVY